MTDISQNKILLSVLIVEDEAINQLILKRALENMGCNIRIVQDGRQAIEILKEDFFDLVFMDIQIPIVDGLEATRMLRLGQAGDLNKETPVFAYTALAGTIDEKKYIDAGMNGCLTKPFHFEDVANILNLI